MQRSHQMFICVHFNMVHTCEEDVVWLRERDNWASVKVCDSPPVVTVISLSICP